MSTSRYFLFDCSTELHNTHSPPRDGLMQSIYSKTVVCRLPECQLAEWQLAECQLAEWLTRRMRQLADCVNSQNGRLAEYANSQNAPTCRMRLREVSSKGGFTILLQSLDPAEPCNHEQPIYSIYLSRRAKLTS